MSSIKPNHSISVKQLYKGEDYIIEYKGVCPYLRKEYIVIALFDGHGDDVSKTFLRTLQNLPLENILKYSQEPTQEIQRQLNWIFLPIQAGATCSIIKIFDDHIDIETTGDSKAIMAINNNIVYVSPEHNYHNPEEKKRLDETIIYRNKKVPDILVLSPTSITQEPDPIVTTFYDKYGNNVCLSLTQSIGHRGITGIRPDRRKIYFSPEDKVDMIVASDGVWDMMNHNFEEDLAMFLSPNTTSEDVAKEAEKRWKQQWKYIYKGIIYYDEKLEIYDDISVGVYHKP